MRKNDIILLTVTFLSAIFAIFAPDFCSPLQPYPLYLMMSLMFLSFLRINFDSLRDMSASSLKRLFVLVLFKLVVLPVTLYWIASLVAPEFAVPVLLLSGISTGVVAPFIANLFDTDVAPVLRMVIVTSLLAPFTLPILVKTIAGAEVEIPLELMVKLLATVIFVPMLAVIVARQFFVEALAKLYQFHFAISLVIFAAINMGVFSKYSHFFFQDPRVLVICVGVSYGLSVVYYLVGFLLVPQKRSSDRIAAGVSFAIMNNVLIIVFSSHFFGPLSPTLAAMYMFPFFSTVVPIKMLVARSKWLFPNA